MCDIKHSNINTDVLLNQINNNIINMYQVYIHFFFLIFQVHL